MNEVNVIVPGLYFVACIIFTIALWIWYPQKQNAKQGVASSVLYTRRKLFDFFLAAVTFLMIIYAGNNWGHLFIKTESAQASSIIRFSKDTAIYNNPLIKKFIAGIKSMDVSKLSHREKLRLIKDQIKAIKHAKENSKSEDSADNSIRYYGDFSYSD